MAKYKYKKHKVKIRDSGHTTLVSGVGLPIGRIVMRPSLINIGPTFVVPLRGISSDLIIIDEVLNG